VCTTMAGNSTFVLCALETSLCPRTVLCKRQEKRATFSSEVQARMRSSTRAPLTTRAVCAGAGVGVSSHGGLRESALGAQRRSTTQSCIVERVWSGASQGCPVRRPVPLRRSLSRASMWTYHKPSCALTYNRRPAPIYGLRWSRPCLDYVFSPIV